MDRVNAIRYSQSAFVCGLLSLLPLIGFIPALIALVHWQRVRRQYHDWNPASAYLKWAAALAVFGLLNSVASAALIGVAISNSMWN